MHSRVRTCLSLFVLAAFVAVGVYVPTLPVRADVEPPFEVTFPQETSKTTFGSSYGDYRSGGRRHKGNDLLAPRMTEVYAVADGVVIHVGTSRLSGRNIRIEHVDGWTSHYVHLNNDNPGTDDGDAPWSARTTALRCRGIYSPGPPPARSKASTPSTGGRLEPVRAGRPS